MPSVTVYLANIARVDEAILANVTPRLSSYFSTVVAGSSYTFGGVRVVTSNRGLALTTSDLLCYIVPNFAHSKVRLFNPHLQNQRGNLGNTAYRQPAPYSAASEVYSDGIHSFFRNNEGIAMANLIFHELMHNKGPSGEELHSMGNGDGLAAAEVNDRSTLSSENASFMRNWLGTEVRQFVTSF